MPTFLIHKWKMRRLKLRVWNRRIQEHLQYVASDFCSLIDCSIDVYWGQFYGGSIIVDRKFRSAKIIIQIPYDGYLTADEQQVLNRYSLKKTMLPYFIFYHEAAHLLDIVPYIGQSDLDGLKRYVATHSQVAGEAPSSSYRDLSFEKQADRYAYQMVMKNCRPAG